MATSKRERQRANRQSKPAPVAEKAPRQLRGLPERMSNSFDKDRVENFIGSLVTGIFVYNIANRTGMLPEIRNHVPEPFDLPDHVGNVFWSVALLKNRFLGSIMERHFIRDTVRHEHGRDETFGERHPATTYIGTAALFGVALNTLLEGATDSLPAIADALTGGLDPIDIAYGAATAVVISAYQARKTHQAIAGGQ